MIWEFAKGPHCKDHGYYIHISGVVYLGVPLFQQLPYREFRVLGTIFGGTMMLKFQCFVLLIYTIGWLVVVGFEGALPGRALPPAPKSVE